MPLAPLGVGGAELVEWVGLCFVGHTQHTESTEQETLKNEE
jgi:hypothetical protein